MHPLAHYLYTATGQRAKKIIQTSSTTWQVTVYVEGLFEHHYEVNNSVFTGEQTLIYILDGQSRLCQRRSGNAFGDQRPAILYTLEDHLHSAAIQVDEQGMLVSYEEYYPFGEISFGGHARKRYRFCGLEFDQESNLLYCGARYYVPWLGRFLSVDPAASSLLSHSSYSYAFNNPLRLTDTDGERPFPAKDATLRQRVEGYFWITEPFAKILDGANNYSFRALELWGWNQKDSAVKAGNSTVRGLIGEAMVTGIIRLSSLYTFQKTGGANSNLSTAKPSRIPEVALNNTITNGEVVGGYDIDIYQRVTNVESVKASFYNSDGSIYQKSFDLTIRNSAGSSTGKGRPINFVYEIKTLSTGLYTDKQLIKGMNQAERNAEAVRTRQGGELTIPVLIVDREAWEKGISNPLVQQRYNQYISSTDASGRAKIPGRLVLIDGLTSQAQAKTDEVRTEIQKGQRP